MDYIDNIVVQGYPELQGYSKEFCFENLYKELLVLEERASDRKLMFKRRLFRRRPGTDFDYARTYKDKYHRAEYQDFVQGVISELEGVPVTTPTGFDKAEPEKPQPKTYDMKKEAEAAAAAAVKKGGEAVKGGIQDGVDEMKRNA